MHKVVVHHIGESYYITIIILILTIICTFHSMLAYHISCFYSAVPMHSAKLAAVAETQANEVERVENLTRRVMGMFETYNRIMADIDRKFAFWDQRLKVAEELICAGKNAKQNDSTS